MVTKAEMLQTRKLSSSGLFPEARSRSRGWAQSVAGAQRAATRRRPPSAGGALRSLWGEEAGASDLVVNVGGALRGHLLDYVHRVPVVPADLLVVRAEDAVRSP